LGNNPNFEFNLFKSPLLKGKATMATKFTPLHDRILVRRVEEADTTRGGIIIPDSAKDKPMEGEVISAGKGKVNEDGKVRPIDVKEGDRILFGKYSGTEIKIDGEDFIIMREEEVSRRPNRRNHPGQERSSRLASVIGF
jgi:chaperonin GroES